jgi:hypothetical protein
MHVLDEELDAVLSPGRARVVSPSEAIRGNQRTSEDIRGNQAHLGE